MRGWGRLEAIFILGTSAVAVAVAWFFGNFFYSLLWAYLARWHLREADMIAYTLANLIPFSLIVLLGIGFYCLVRYEIRRQVIVQQDMSEALVQTTSLGLARPALLLVATAISLPAGIVMIIFARNGFIPNQPIPIDVESAFKSVADTYPDLGKPGLTIKGDIAYQAPFEHGIGVWYKSLGALYGLMNDGKVIQIINAIWPTEPEWYDETKLASKISGVPPRGKRRPIGGFAQNWDTFKPLGWRLDWSCNLDSGTTYYQRFESGVVVGPFRYAQSYPQSRQGAFLTVIKNNKIWNLFDVNTAVSECKS
jgi:hypothetical protein